MSAAQKFDGPIRLKPGYPESWGTIRNVPKYVKITNASYHAAKDGKAPFRSDTSGLRLFKYSERKPEGEKTGNEEKAHVEEDLRKRLEFKTLHTEPRHRVTPVELPKFWGYITAPSSLPGSLNHSTIYFARDMTASFCELIGMHLSGGKNLLGLEKMRALVEQAVEGGQSPAGAVFKKIIADGADIDLYRVNLAIKTLDISIDNEAAKDFIAAVSAKCEIATDEIYKGLTLVGDHTTAQGVVTGVSLAIPDFEAICYTCAPAQYVKPTAKNFAIRGKPGTEPRDKISGVEKWRFLSKDGKGFSLDGPKKGSSEVAKG